MSGDNLEHLIRDCIPQPVITDDRLDRLMDAVLRETARSSPIRQKSWPWANWFPVLQFALPMIIAVVMGVSVGAGYANDWPVAQLSNLILSPLLITEES